MKITLPKDVEKVLAEKAREANISPEDAARLILSEFVKGYGSQVYVGTWRKGMVGGKSGMRYIVEWPFQPGFVKIPGDQSIDIENGR
jgi:hypothetical protein